MVISVVFWKKYASFSPRDRASFLERSISHNYLCLVGALMCRLAILFDVDAPWENLYTMNLIIWVSYIVSSFSENYFWNLLISIRVANRVVKFFFSTPLVALPSWANGLKLKLFTGYHLRFFWISAVDPCATSDTTVSVGTGRAVWKHWKLLLKENSAVSV